MTHAHNPIGRHSIITNRTDTIINHVIYIDIGYLHYMLSYLFITVCILFSLILPLNLYGGRLPTFPRRQTRKIFVYI